MSAIFKFLKYRKDTLIPTFYFANFAVAFIENTRRSIRVMHLQASVFGEFNGILHETKHFSFDLDSIPPLHMA